MEKCYTTAGFGSAAHDRLGIADVVRSYGLDTVHRRIEQLRVTGMHYAATAIERELAATLLTGPPDLLERRSA
ncbi:hypothetical protein GFY24_24175 [Nocardia sp. SYP-A9097]|uniref:hypothetical protein n=1 Tax=Nocardia sp. SYP-A9097 TaxID=2663237 RepID=UPI00129B6C69|nr:hypothetical protein [Nocardia sp. SYP-A9097]MRH90504.1 hypothetical protein [Nocardia sp. SYP-A9097]